jgi:hypothetical protein
MALPVEDRPTGGLDADETELVVLRSFEVAVAGEDLERPETKEEHREHAESDRAQDAYAERELRSEPIRLTRLRIGR